MMGCRYKVSEETPVQGEIPWTGVNGSGGTRTHGHELKRLMLYQLSYRPQAIAGA